MAILLRKINTILWKIIFYIIGIIILIMGLPMFLTWASLAWCFSDMIKQDTKENGWLVASFIPVSILPLGWLSIVWCGRVLFPFINKYLFSSIQFKL